jgi:hypothetical protein
MAPGQVHVRLRSAALGTAMPRAYFTPPAISTFGTGCSLLSSESVDALAQFGLVVVEVQAD